MNEKRCAVLITQFRTRKMSHRIRVKLPSTNLRVNKIALLVKENVTETKEKYVLLWWTLVTFTASKCSVVNTSSGK